MSAKKMGCLWVPKPASAFVTRNSYTRGIYRSEKWGVLVDRMVLEKTLDEHLSKGHQYFRAQRKFEPTRNTLKSYIVEANTDREVVDPIAFEAFIQSLDIPTKVRVQPTEDPTLFELFVGRRESHFYADILDSRFWVLHTVDESSDSDASIRGLVLRTRLLDFAWIPTQQLDSWTGDLGVRRQMTARHSIGRPTLLEEPVVSDSLGDGMVLRLSSTGDVGSRWKDYQSSSLTSSSMALWSCRIVRGSTTSEIAIDDVTAVGKITARGDSFRLHTEIVNGLRQRYSELISTWETNFRINWESSLGGLSPQGAPAEIAFYSEQTEEDLTSLIETMFSSSDPFRLYGVPRLVRNNSYSVRAVDLHTGDLVSFEFNPELIRIYLADDSCANVLARVLTNLQQFYDARMSLR